MAEPVADTDPTSGPTIRFTSEALLFIGESITGIAYPKRLEKLPLILAAWERTELLEHQKLYSAKVDGVRNVTLRDQARDARKAFKKISRSPADAVENARKLDDFARSALAYSIANRDGQRRNREDYKEIEDRLKNGSKSLQNIIIDAAPMR